MELRKALTETKIKKGFAATGIWPLCPSAMDLFMQPSSYYVETVVELEDDNTDEEEAAQDNTDVVEDCIPKTQPPVQQYFIDAQSGSKQPSSENTDSEEEVTETTARRNLFPLPQVQRPPQKQAQEGEPLIDYSKSILMTSEDYIAAMATKAARKEVVAKEQEERKNQAELRKAQCEEEKARKEAEKLLRRIQTERKKAEREREKARRLLNMHGRPLMEIGRGMDAATGQL